MWIPHQTWLNRYGITRDKHLIENLKSKHEIHIIQHTHPSNYNFLTFIKPKLLIDSLKDWIIFKDGLYHHHIRHLYFTRFNMIVKFNNRIFQRKIREIIKEFGIELLVCGPNYYLHGYPPFDLSIPIVFDYLDFLADFKNPNIENSKVLYNYIENSSGILCVSQALIDSINDKYKNKTYYLPNGVDLKFFQSFKDFEKKEDLKYISLIGLSISESLFFLDIFPEIKKYKNNIKMLLVGGGHRLPPIKNYLKKYKNYRDYILTNYIPYEKIREYFNMTDVGLYPTLKNHYFDSACPLKVMEYSAALKPVVSTDLTELRNLNFPNVFLAKPTKKDFIEKILLALDYKGPFPNLKEFDWKYLSGKLENIFKNI
ncbi:hypothetical protein LCGC14_1925860 [marine sediment metagenome]|uniref:Glycosyl transferase family 1 domain-containing protein n=1 Tax=marine sediment metagenome TaxID=412755 RepID=A0A0F9FQ24_9ZZZZ